MKLFSCICESMTWDDLSGQSIPGHRLVRFDPHPATFSAQSLWLMQCRAILPPPASNPHVGESWFNDATIDFLSLRARTRLVSNFWPTKYDPTRLDPLCACHKPGRIVGMEPNNHQWDTLMEYLDNPGCHDWLIFWPTMGHCGYRVPGENSGIPVHIKDTAGQWLTMACKNILPKIPGEARTILFSDHGSARKDKTKDEQFRNGFAFVDDRIECPDKLDWEEMRKLQERLLCS